MSRWGRGLPAGRSSFPRVSGDEPGQDANKLVSTKFSPRERG